MPFLHSALKLVAREGFKPSRLSALAPKASVYVNSTTEPNWWTGEELNLRSTTALELQSSASTRQMRPIHFKKSSWVELNHRYANISRVS